MPYRPSPTAPIQTYRGYHVNAATSQPAAAGMLLDATGSVVSAAGSATITLTLVDGDVGAVAVGDLLICDTGASYEAAPITAINVPARQVTAIFANTHLAGFAVRVTHGSYLGGVAFNQPGSSMTITLYDGHPSSGASTTLAIITPPSGASLDGIACAADQGLFFTYTGVSAGDLTILALPSL